MGINKQWHSTLSFRKFREKTYELSRIYWTQQLAADCLAQVLKTKEPKDSTVKAISASFDFRMHTQSVSETIAFLPTFMERNRLHLLAIYTAFLESYLKDITLLYTASLGHIDNPNENDKPIKLSAVGEAISYPIIRSSTVPDMIKYASNFFEINFGKNADEWIKIYKIRCAAVHNGGIATPQFLKKIGQPLSLKPKEYDNIGLTWDELRNAMKYADDIAAMIDMKVSNEKIRILETDELLRETKANKKLPIQKKLWQFLHDDYGLFPIPKAEKIKLSKKFY